MEQQWRKKEDPGSPRPESPTFRLSPHRGVTHSLTPYIDTSGKGLEEKPILQVDFPAYHTFPAYRTVGFFLAFGWPFV